jgi:hypothetical protein
MTDVPVALFLYNRPDIVGRVFEAIRTARPSRLYLIADGPRTPREAESCAAARMAVRQVDWECEVVTNFSDQNLGCSRRISSGLDQLFDQEDRASILEDDCVPDNTFFRFAGELLDRYADDERVMTISGDNFQFGKRSFPASYYFSRYPHCWGWATWSRAWRHYEPSLADWESLRDSDWLQRIVSTSGAVKFWSRTFDQVRAGRTDSWAYRWTYSCWVRGGLAILPVENLVSNIGFGDQATHTRVKSVLSEIEAVPLKFPLSHPSGVNADEEADRFTERLIFHAGDFRSRVRSWFLQKRIGRSL